MGDKRSGNYARGDNHWSHQHPDRVRHGSEHFNWRGERATVKAGRQRARASFALGPCERCGKNGVERHHKDANPLNNDPENIEILCRHCHMEIDGRLERFKLTSATAGLRDPRPCITCGEIARPARKGRCTNCAMYFRRTGVERPPALWGTKYSPRQAPTP